MVGTIYSNNSSFCTPAIKIFQRFFTTLTLNTCLVLGSCGYDITDAPCLMTLYFPCMLKESLPCQPPLPWVLWLAHRACQLPPMSWAPRCLLLLALHTDCFLPATPASITYPHGGEVNIYLFTSNRNVCSIYQPSESTMLQVPYVSKNLLLSRALL